MLVRAHDPCPIGSSVREPLPKPVHLVRQLGLAGAGALDHRRRRLRRNASLRGGHARRRASPRPLRAPARAAARSSRPRRRRRRSITVASISPPGSTISGSPDGRGSASAGQLQHSGRARASRSIAGASASNRSRPRRTGTATCVSSQLAASIRAAARALRIAAIGSNDCSEPRLHRGRARPRPASGRRSAGPGPSCRCGSAAQSASVTNGMTGCSRRRYVSSASTSVHHVASRVLGRQRRRRPGGPWRARGPSRRTRSRSPS